MTAHTTKYIETVYIFSNFITRARENDCLTNSVSREYCQNDEKIIYHRRSYVPELPTRCAVQRDIDLFHQRFLANRTLVRIFSTKSSANQYPLILTSTDRNLRADFFFAFFSALFSNAFRTRNSTDAIDRIFWRIRQTVFVQFIYKSWSELTLFHLKNQEELT